MFRLIVTEMSTGQIRSLRDVISGEVLLDLMDNMGRDTWDHIRITLWSDVDGNMGSREYNSPFGGYDRERVMRWARADQNVTALIATHQKIQAIKRVKEAWPSLRLKTAKELVEEITPHQYR